MRERDDLVNFDELPIWMVAQGKCPVCGVGDISVYPLTAERLECSGCHRMNPAPALPQEPAGRDLTDRRAH